MAAALALAVVATGAALAATVERLSLEGLVERAALSVHGRVAATRTGVDADGTIFTEVEIECFEVLVGKPMTHRVITRFYGGTAGGRTLVVPGLPRFRPGDEAVLFLSPENDAGYRFPVGLGQGVFRVARDEATGAAVCRQEVAGLALVDPVTRRVAPAATPRVEALDALLDRIRALARERR